MHVQLNLYELNTDSAMAPLKYLTFKKSSPKSLKILILIMNPFFSLIVKNHF